MAEVVNVKQDHAERGFGALDAVSFAEEHGEDGFTVVDAGEAVDLRVEDEGFTGASRVEGSDGEIAGPDRCGDASKRDRRLSGSCRRLRLRRGGQYIPG